MISRTLWNIEGKMQTSAEAFEEGVSHYPHWARYTRPN
ncbi:unnamed protein product, partial [marine sediment metagenome]